MPDQTNHAAGKKIQRAVALLDHGLQGGGLQEIPLRNPPQIRVQLNQRHVVPVFVRPSHHVVLSDVRRPQ